MWWCDGPHPPPAAPVAASPASPASLRPAPAQPPLPFQPKSKPNEKEIRTTNHTPFLDIIIIKEGRNNGRPVRLGLPANRRTEPRRCAAALSRLLRAVCQCRRRAAVPTRLLRRVHQTALPGARRLSSVPRHSQGVYFLFIYMYISITSQLYSHIIYHTYHISYLIFHMPGKKRICASASVCYLIYFASYTYSYFPIIYIFVITLILIITVLDSLASIFKTQRTALINTFTAWKQAAERTEHVQPSPPPPVKEKITMTSSDINPHKRQLRHSTRKIEYKEMDLSESDVVSSSLSSSPSPQLPSTETAEPTDINGTREFLSHFLNSN